MDVGVWIPSSDTSLPPPPSCLFFFPACKCSSGHCALGELRLLSVWEDKTKRMHTWEKITWWSGGRLPNCKQVTQVWMLQNKDLFTSTTYSWKRDPSSASPFHSSLILLFWLNLNQPKCAKLFFPPFFNFSPFFCPAPAFNLSNLPLILSYLHLWKYIF